MNIHVEPDSNTTCKDSESLPTNYQRSCNENIEISQSFNLSLNLLLLKQRFVLQ